MTTTTRSSIELNGSIQMPGDKESHQASFSIDRKTNEVELNFDSTPGGAKSWIASSVVLKRRLKYYELVFQTSNLPVENLVLTWKMNIALSDRMAAGVVLARPNELKVKGEHGFTLVASGEASGIDNYLTQLESGLYRTFDD